MTPPASLRALLEELVDYAGLFPPAACSMEQAAVSYAAYRRSPDSWALGRFVVPAARLGELADAARVEEAAWRLTALVGPDLDTDAATVRDFARRHGDRFAVDAVECRAGSPADVAAACAALQPLGMTVYVEVPSASEPAQLLDAVLDAVLACGARAKIRTGGVTADAIPPAACVARFIVRCAERELPFKATAGLHHPLRGEHALTYEPAAPRGTMFGFLNVFLAAARAADGAREDEVERLLLLADPDSLHFRDDGIALPGATLSLDAVRRLRARVALSFGSCSFTEPLDDLRRLAYL